LITTGVCTRASHRVCTIRMICAAQVGAEYNTPDSLHRPR
jgi:hypothetical protein